MFIELLVGLFIAFSMFLAGFSVQTIKKLIKVILTFILSLLNKLGIKINYKERDLNVDKTLFIVYPNIIAVKRGALGMKKKRSINLFAVILVGISLLLIILNLSVVTNNMITNWLASLIQGIGINIDAIDMNTIYTAAVFSVLSFGLTKLLTQWKETSDIRKEIKKQKRKKDILNEMSSKELIEEAEKKDRFKMNGGN